MAKTGYFDYFKKPTLEGAPKQLARTQAAWMTGGLSEVPVFEGESLFNKLEGFDPFADPEMRLQGLRNDPQPMIPGYEGVLGGDGMIQDRYRLNVGKDIGYDPVQLQVNEGALQELRNRAMGTGPSTWATLLKDQNDLESRFAQDKLKQQGMSDLALSQSQLAMRGGLQGGAAERLASQNTKNIAMQRHQLLQDQMKQRLGIGIEDERQRTGILQALPGMELGYGQAKADVGFRNSENATKTAFQNRQNQLMADQYNIGNTLRDIQGRNAYNQGSYAEQMKAWAANKQADATAAAGNKDSWICTKIDSHTRLSKVEKGELAKFLRFSLNHNPQVTRFYLQRCAPLVEKMTTQGVDWNQMRWFVEDICELVRLGEMERAFNRYKEDVVTWIEKYWPECADPVMHRLRAERKLRDAQLTQTKGA
jgi:hypothetical protein